MKDILDYSLLSHNTFGINAYCRRFVEYATTKELQDVLLALRLDREERFLHIGGGSNMLFTRDFNGTILHSAILGYEIIDETEDFVLLRIGAGEDWDKTVSYTIGQGYYGIENLSLIPGEVGASAVQNIGAYGVEAGQYIASVETIDTETGEFRTFSSEECQYGYRYSVFKGGLRGKYVVTHVTYRLVKRFIPHLEYGGLRREIEKRGIDENELTAMQLRDVIIEVRRAKLPDPQVLGSAGSFFINPVVSMEQFEAIAKQYPELPHYHLDNGVKIPAGWMIEQCGWKGKNLGKAGVYEKQALVLVNRGGATGSDIVRLAERIAADVFQKFGVVIHPEVNYIE